MSEYKVFFKSSADRQLRKLPDALQRRIIGEVDMFAHNPRPKGVVKLFEHDNLWRIRVGDYRIVYEIHEDRLVILVLRVGDAPRTVLEELAKIKSGDVVLPTATRAGRYNGMVRLRCVTEPDEAQKVLLHRLGITLPRRLRRINEFVQM